VVFNFISKLYFLQNLLGGIVSYIIPPFFIHNLGKYFAIKKAFYLSDIENLEGDYVEFGVFTGSSMACAIQCARSSRVGKIGTSRFFGFDSFCGFGDLPEGDKHPFYTNVNFETKYDSVSKRLNKLASKEQKVYLVKGFFNETCDDVSPEKYGIGKASVILFDNDTYTAAKSCFKFCDTIIQEGTILIIDDYFSYKGNEKKGVCGAFWEWQKSNKKFNFRRISDYGMGGCIFIASLTA